MYALYVKYACTAKCVCVYVFFKKQRELKQRESKGEHHRVMLQRAFTYDQCTCNTQAWHVPSQHKTHTFDTRNTQNTSRDTETHLSPDWFEAICDMKLLGKHAAKNDDLKIR